MIELQTYIQKEENSFMNDFTRNLADVLFNQDKLNNLINSQLEQIINDLLESELTAFLGYNPYEKAGWNSGNSRNGCYFRKIDTQFGPLKIKVPRDRMGKFEQHTLPSYTHHTNALETTIIQLYSKGITTREIADLIEKMYGSYYSPTTVSNISKQMIPKVEKYHQRKLADKFFCVYLDATYVPLKRLTFDNEAVYIAIGIKPDGHKEIIDFRIEPTESVEIWTEMLKDFKTRGLKQVELFLSDGVVGMKTALIQVYPKAKFQRCLVHVMRNICKKVRVSDRNEVMQDFKQIHMQMNKAQAEQVLNNFYQKWKDAYKNMVKGVKEIEDNLLTFYNYPRQIRPSIYSTNLIESFNNILKRKIKPKTEFPTEESLDTFIGVQAMEYNARNINRAHKGFKEVQDTLESYFD